MFAQPWNAARRSSDTVSSANRIASQPLGSVASRPLRIPIAIWPLGIREQEQGPPGSYGHSAIVASCRKGSSGEWQNRPYLPLRTLLLLAEYAFYCLHVDRARPRSRASAQPANRRKKPRAARASLDGDAHC